jgi:oxygen-independent coproporphyrinogen-3 oxidase
MNIIQNGYCCTYEMNLFAKLFFSEEEDVLIYSNFSYQDEMINVYTTIIFEGDTYFEDYYYPFSEKEKDMRLQKKVFIAACTKSFCHAAQKIREVQLPWGVMCGIRPAKIVRELLEQGYSREQTRQTVAQIYETKEEKIELAIKVAENERVLLSSIPEHSISLYIGIPFCPTRCLYCSFVSTDVRVSGKYMDEYVRLLLKEIEKTAEIISKMGVFVETVYIGGGTPTTLSAEQLSAIFSHLNQYFASSKLHEFTLEAGRPDTITEQKLSAAFAGGVNRISINPQSMNQQTLQKVGRTHSPEMVKDCFKMARKAGFENINMDLIAGLPGETPQMFSHSLNEVIELDPENITVHSMCIKRAASLRFSQQELTQAQDMNLMLNETQARMKQTGREPYYMYRQKNILGNLENVGYARPGTMSAYNVNIMEEVQTILALGGGGSTKIVMDGRIERIFNFKDPYEYIRRFDEILKKKDLILEILGVQ